jgi:hypothetical protein
MLLETLDLKGKVVTAPHGVAVDTNNDGNFDKWVGEIYASYVSVCFCVVSVCFCVFCVLNVYVSSQTTQ